MEIIKEDGQVKVRVIELTVNYPKLLLIFKMIKSFILVLSIGVSEWSYSFITESTLYFFKGRSFFIYGY